MTTEANMEGSLQDQLMDGDIFANNPEPRCACILVLDTSWSMSGQPMDQLNMGLRHFKECLEQDNLASLRTEIAVLEYNSKPTLRHDFSTVDTFDPPELRPGNGTVMSTAMREALRLVEERKETYRQNAITYYRPWIWIICDGRPEHDGPGEFDRAVQEIHQAEENRQAAVYVVGVEGADMQVLNRISSRSEALQLKGLDFRGMFEWLASSMSAVSQSQPDETVNLQSPMGWGAVPQ